MTPKDLQGNGRCRFHVVCPTPYRSRGAGRKTSAKAIHATRKKKQSEPVDGAVDTHDRTNFPRQPRPARLAFTLVVQQALHVPHLLYTTQ
jgi:hypothetical protein